MVAMMNFRYAMPDHLVDLGRIPELAGITIEAKSIRLGAMTRQRELEFSAALADVAPLFKAALAYVGHRQTRNRGTLGGSLSHADPAAELPTVCLAYDAEIEIRGSGGSRGVLMRDFVAGFMTTAVGFDELLYAVHLERWPEGHGYSFQEYARRHGDFAITGAVALLDCAADETVRRAAIALCGVGDGPVRRDEAEAILIGKRIDDALIARAAVAAAEIDPIEDIHGTATYRRHLARILTARALREARERARTSKRVTA
ncbi:MAG: xanthine dehydrogenase family protein subunit M [Beijerinckiaceae bacterium]